MNQITHFRGEYAFLSNFQYVEINYEGIDYTSVENAYQSCKTEDMELRVHVATISSVEAKKWGKKVKLRDDWHSIKVPLMKNLLLLKFQSNEYLKRKLIATGDDFIVEGNDHKDDFWGICNGRGHNMLGVLLMYVRWHIKNL